MQKKRCLMKRRRIKMVSHVPITICPSSFLANWNYLTSLPYSYFTTLDRYYRLKLTILGASDKQQGEVLTAASGQLPVHDGDLSYPPGGEHHLDHHKSHSEVEQFAAQMTALFILEFGVVFHSIFIGLTLAVAGDEFNVLYIVLVFHQTFEGLGLGSRLATAQWPKSKWWMPWILGSLYGITTPVAIAVGIGIRESFAPGSNQTLIVNGIFDSISAGILLYTGLVELMAHEFMFNSEMRKAKMGMVLGAFGCMCLGAGLMALLGKWA